jgi:uncharacterized protein YyaL (SSP411 family)
VVFIMFFLLSEHELPAGRVEKKSDCLINVKGLCLLKHSHNPTDWYPRSEEAFRRARDGE